MVFPGLHRWPLSSSSLKVPPWEIFTTPMASNTIYRWTTHTSKFLTLFLGHRLINPVACGPLQGCPRDTSKTQHTQSCTHHLPSPSPKKTLPQPLCPLLYEWHSRGLLLCLLPFYLHIWSIQPQVCKRKKQYFVTDYNSSETYKTTPLVLFSVIQLNILDGLAILFKGHRNENFVPLSDSKCQC